MKAIAAAFAFLFLMPEVLPAGELRKDIEYGNVDGEKLLLDAFVPKGDGPFPVAIIIHGGGWGSGDKAADVAPMIEPLSNDAFVWFSINYRLAPKNRWPKCYDDVLAAIRWVKEHAADYKGDPRHVALMGYSAGGQLAAFVAVKADKETSVQALVGFAPPTDLVSDSLRRGGLSKALQDLLDRPQQMDEAATKILHELSPLDHVSAAMPPCLLIHGTADKTVPIEQSVNFQAKLKAAGVACELIQLQGAPHGIMEWDKFDADYRKKLVEWLGRELSK